MQIKCTRELHDLAYATSNVNASNPYIVYAISSKDN